MADKQPVVWVTQESSHNFSSAEKYGEIQFLAREDLINIKGSLHNEKLVSRMVTKLSSFDPSTDWIVVAGSPYVAALVFLLMGRMGFKTINVLRWDNREFKYQPMSIDTRGM